MPVFHSGQPMFRQRDSQIPEELQKLIAEALSDDYDSDYEDSTDDIAQEEPGVEPEPVAVSGSWKKLFHHDGYGLDNGRGFAPIKVVRNPQTGLYDFFGDHGEKNPDDLTDRVVGFADHLVELSNLIDMDELSPEASRLIGF